MLICNSLAANNISKIREVLKHVETNYRIEMIGDGGDSFGILQIQEAVIIDINLKYGTNYIHQDAFDEVCAEEIFELYIQMYAEKLEKREKRPVTEQDIVRIWNGGPYGYKRSSTLDYLEKYKHYKDILVMNKRNCIINRKQGVIMESYTYTYDVFMYKSRKMMFGVSKKVVHLLPKIETQKEIRAKTQLTLAI